MRIGYCSPLNPMRSGVSDFSEELLPALAEHMDIAVFSPADVENRSALSGLELHRLDELDDAALRNSLDCIVYHMGNNEQFHGAILDMLRKYPGIVEIHDYGMHHLMAQRFYIGGSSKAYLQMAEYCHGMRGRRIVQAFLDGTAPAPWDAHALDMVMNRYILENAVGIVTHSESARQMALGEFPNTPITKIMLQTEFVDDPEKYKNACRGQLQIPKDAVVCGSFGFATSAKRILPTLDALRLAAGRLRRPLRYYIVGQPQPELHLEDAIRERGLEDMVRVTGYTSLDDFKIYMGACDFCLNLRYPTQGESSASLHRMFGMGKPAIVTNIGTFADYPEDIVRKVSYGESEAEEIAAAVEALSNDKGALQKRSAAALAFARENCDLKKNASAYADFFRQVCRGTWQPPYEDVMIGRLCELGLTDDGYTSHIWPALSVFTD